MLHEYRRLTIELIECLASTGYTHIILDDQLVIPREKIYDMAYDDVFTGAKFLRDYKKHFLEAVPLKSLDKVDNQLHVFGLDERRDIEELLGVKDYFYYVKREALPKIPIMDNAEYRAIDLAGNLERLNSKGYRYLVLNDEVDQSCLGIDGGYEDVIFVECIPEAEEPAAGTPFVPLTADALKNEAYSYLVKAKYFE